MNGILIVDKPQGVTSHDVVDELRKLLKQKSIGHAGTLDPLATGLLVCLVGEATKLSQFVMDQDKTYEVLVRLGVKTDSGDITGKIVQEKTVEVNEDRVRDVVESLKGPLELCVPKYSAVKVAGRKLYEYARKQEDVEVPLKTMTIHEVKIKEIQPSAVHLEIWCGKGTYVRSWVEKLGELLGCGATVEKLRRIGSGRFGMEQATSLAEIAALPYEERQTKLLPMPSALGDWPSLKLVGRDLVLVRNGQIPRGVMSMLRTMDERKGVKFITAEGRLAALAVREGLAKVKLARVFHDLGPESAVDTQQSVR